MAITVKMTIVSGTGDLRKELPPGIYEKKQLSDYDIKELFSRGLAEETKSAGSGEDGGENG